MVNTMSNKILRVVAFTALILSFVVVMVGAYTRLTDAGLGCPDWPGCYGHYAVPKSQDQLQQAQMQYPQLPVESEKAWTEMIHRYLAGTLGLLVILLSLSLLVKRLRGNTQLWCLPMVLITLIFFQAALGMWTVTLKLLPVVVMGHLLGGMLIVACLSRVNLEINHFSKTASVRWRPWLILGLAILFIQIALGGWVSSNYAGISCIGFPQCNGLWVPKLHFSQGFNLFSALGTNYQGGVLEHEVRVTIQFIHRVGALITAVYLFSLGMAILTRGVAGFRVIGLILSILVVVQFVLGIINVTHLLPLAIAVAHNGVAALLFAVLFSALYFIKRENSHAA